MLGVIRLTRPDTVGPDAVPDAEAIRRARCAADLYTLWDTRG
jgi:hypothetical protein